MSNVTALLFAIFFFIVLINTSYTYFWFALFLPIGMLIVWVYYLRASYLWLRFMTVFSSIVSDTSIEKKYGEKIEIFTDGSLERNRLLTRLFPFNHSKWSRNSEKLDLNFKIINPQEFRENLSKSGISEYPFQVIDFFGSLKRNGKELLRYVPQNAATDWERSKIKANKFAEYFHITSVSTFIYLVGKFSFLPLIKLQSYFLIAIDFLWLSLTLVATYFVVTTYKRGVRNEKELIELRKKEEDKENELRLLKQSASALGYTNSAEADFIKKHLERREKLNKKFNEEHFFEYLAD
jgi:hypothetical protein